ncbi:MAG: hypothetical protein IPN40_09180 [Uliginosibacterium sp.]|nr:hypothetical protein [Uliginosibacterium sp.]
MKMAQLVVAANPAVDAFETHPEHTAELRSRALRSISPCAWPTSALTATPAWL